MSHQITQQAIAKAAADKATSTITEAAISQAKQRENRQKRPIAIGSSSASSYGGRGVFSSVGDAVGAVGNFLFGGSSVPVSSSGMRHRYQKMRAVLIIHYRLYQARPTAKAMKARFNQRGI